MQFFPHLSSLFLLDYLYIHNSNLVYKITEPILENHNEQLILANHSLKQLNIIDDDNYKGKYSSVVKMLNECITPMGKRKFAYSFLNPVTDEEYLQNEYIIQFFYTFDKVNIIILMLRNTIPHL